MPQPAADTNRCILLVEDDPDIARLVTLSLQRAGYQVIAAQDGVTGYGLAIERQPDLIILDRMLPQLDGIEVCRRVRQQSQVPILMLTAKSSVADRVEGLDSGANDYLAKPFDPEELLARIRAHLRVQRPAETQSLWFADVLVCPERHEASRGGRPLGLSPKEFDLLTYLLQNPFKVLKRQQILRQVWGNASAYDSNVLDVYIGYLRQKLEQDGAPRLIHTKRGIGFELSDAPPDAPVSAPVRRL